MSNYVSKLALASLIAAGLIGTASADFITGKVTDASGTAPLQGAIVSIDGLNRTATTDRFGEYRLSNVPAGDYNVIVDYVGTDTATASVSVTSAGASLDFTLGSDVRYLDNILVVGSAAAQAGAINQQRASDAIISVIDSDGLGNFPDTTVADSLARVAGLSIETDQGEGRYVSIRGINSDLISTSINGVRTPSPEDRRGVLLDGVPSDLLDGIEIQKSLTPDVDADSLGGVINLKTISAFDRDGRFIRAKIEGRWNEITEEISPKATLTYSEVFNDTLGVALSVNYQDLAIESHNNEAGGFGITDTGIGFLNDDYEHRWYDLTRERLGLVANFDWRVNESTDLYLRTLFNNYQDDEVRNKFEFRDLDDVDTDTGIGPDGSTTLPLNEVDAEVRVRKETRNIQTIAVGGETQTGDWLFEYEASYAFADEQDDDNHDVTFRFEDIQDNFPGDVTFDLSDPQQPRLTEAQSVIDAIYDPANYELDAFEREFSVNEDTEYGARFDVSKDSLLNDIPVVWKAGLKLRDREKTRDEDFLFFEPDLNLADFANNTFIDGWRLANPQPTWPDPALTRDLRSQFNDPTDPDFVQEDSFIDSAVADYTLEERILAGYGMGTFDFGQLTLVAGVRVEQTDIDLRGVTVNSIDEDNLSSSDRSFSDDYTNILPSLNAKYEFSDKLIGRAAYYAAVVRPAFGEMAPAAVINDDLEVEAGNPSLDPYEADNFDLSLEYYPTELSVISVGVFYKDIENAIFPERFDREVIGEDTNGDDILEAFTDFQARVPIDLGFLNNEGITRVDTLINVDSTELYGIEFNYVQGLGDLNEALNGFLVSANLTLTDSEATIPNEGDPRNVPFLKQSDTVWNLAVGYDKGPWNLRISANYRGDYLDSLEGEDFDRYTDDRLLVEASAKYRVNDSLQLYVEGKNLTDEPEYYYFGDERRLSQYDEFGSTYVFGARLTF